jgi:ribonuclease HII
LSKHRNTFHLTRFAEEKLCEEQGYRLIAGTDEVGRGCLAGPVVASAVIMPRDQCPQWYHRVRDSKMLAPEQREELSTYIHEAAVTIGTGAVDAGLIDSLGMTRAVDRAMSIAIEHLQPRPDYILIDYLTIRGLHLPQKGVADGDSLCFSIACASIVAKVFRDRLMVDQDKKYPGYGFAHHKGYSTEEHVACLRKLGPSPIHRRLFSPVKNLAQMNFEDILSTFDGQHSAGQEHRTTEFETE